MDKKIVDALNLIKSVCPDCKTKGQIIKDGNFSLCVKCSGKGYQTFDELKKEL